jgi:hypothetical protein
VVETGELLIICHDAFMSAMQPFVNWKKQIGRPTTMVGTSTAGTTSTAIQAYIQGQYNANPNLSHVLLVGDVGHERSPERLRSWRARVNCSERSTLRAPST